MGEVHCSIRLQDGPKQNSQDDYHGNPEENDTIYDLLFQLKKENKR